MKVQVVVTQEHWDRAVAACEGKVGSPYCQSCVLSQAIRDVLPDYESTGWRKGMTPTLEAKLPPVAMGIRGAFDERRSAMAQLGLPLDFELEFTPRESQ